MPHLAAKFHPTLTGDFTIASFLMVSVGPHPYFAYEWVCLNRPVSVRVGVLFFDGSSTYHGILSHMHDPSLEEHSRPILLSSTLTLEMGAHV